MVPHFKFILQATPVFLFLLWPFGVIGGLMCIASVAYVGNEIVCSPENVDVLLQGLEKGAEFDVQLECEPFVKHIPPMPIDTFGGSNLGLGQDRKELEYSKLHKKTLLNGQNPGLLIIGAPCGCLAARVEDRGPKKVCRIEKWLGIFLLLLVMPLVIAIKLDI